MTTTPRTPAPIARLPFKHFDNGNGYEYCSGREGWPKRKTTIEAQVTCCNCKKALARADLEKMQS